jgi:hypothetical protein
MSDCEDEPKIATGFDRGIEFKEMKQKLIDEYDMLVHGINNLSIDDRYYVSRKRKLIHRLIYCLISMIQLRNGSRVIEACQALPLFYKDGINNKVIVKIAKSKSIKYKKGTKEKYQTKARYRKMILPNWIILEFEEDIIFYLKYIEAKRLMKRTLDYLLKYFKCNTHSLRYSFINYQLYERKKEMSLVAKFVGHVNMDQLVRYTQQTNVDAMLDEDI